MVTKPTGNPPGRPKKYISLSERRARGRPNVPLLQNPQRGMLAFHLAHSRMIKMNSIRNNRRLGRNMASIWLTMMTRGDVLAGDAVQDVPGCPTGFVQNCPNGTIPAVVMHRRRNEPIDLRETRGPARAIEQKISRITRKGNAVEQAWLQAATRAFELCLIAALTDNEMARIEAKLIARSTGDNLIISAVENLPALTMSTG